MSYPRFLIVKYVPDFMRMEPKNVGVIVWTADGISSRFIGEKSHTRGEVDGRSVPAYVKDGEVYKQWVRYWTRQISQEYIEPLKGGEPISSTCPKFLDILSETARGNFLLSDGGFSFDELAPEDSVDSLTQHLFDSLVAPSTDASLLEVKDLSLQTVSEKVLDKSGIKSSSGFMPDYKVNFRVGEQEEQIKFSHAFKNGALHLFQKVTLSRAEDNRLKNVYSAAYKFEKAEKIVNLKRDHNYSLIYASEEQAKEPQIRSAVAILGECSQVINLAIEEDSFTQTLAKMASHATAEH